MSILILYRIRIYVFRICINAYVTKRLKPILTNLDPKIRIFTLSYHYLPFRIYIGKSANLIPNI